jgi:3-oxoacyl-[acyl-carrier protein] reductase
MTTQLQHKTAIITGAAQGIGLQIALELLENGANVLINDYHKVHLDKIQDQLAKWEGNYILHQGDASDKTVIEEMVSSSVNQFGSLDAVVANAGITLSGPFLTFPEEKLRKMFEVNLIGSFLLAQAAANQMKVQDTGGRILFISSITGFRSHPTLEGYSMTKSALRMLAKSLAPELAEHGITVNCVAPGATETERTVKQEGYAAGWAEVIPTGRPSTTEDIAKACLYFLGPYSSQVTGQTLLIDGGWSAIGPLPEHL